MDLLSEYRRLPLPLAGEGNTFSVLPTMDPESFIGKDPSGLPALLIKAREAERVRRGPIVLSNITVQHNIRCEFLSDTGKGIVVERVSLVRCVSEEPALRDYFVQVAEAITRRLAGQTCFENIVQAIERLAQLFEAFDQPGKRTAQGLWAELVLLSFSESPDNLIDAWHTDPEATHDFAAGTQRVEVKSFGGTARIHSFSHRQVHVGPLNEAVIASIRTERASLGATIPDLIRALEARGISDSSLEKLELVTARTLGDGAPSALSLGFDVSQARTSLRFFDAASVPSIGPVLPPGVISAHFCSLLDEQLALAPYALRQRNALFRWMVPN